MKVLHLSDTTLSGSPIRISNLLQKYGNVESRHLVYRRRIYDRVFDVDLVGEEMAREEISRWLGWADILHLHNRWRRQLCFFGEDPPRKPAVIQIHSPRASEDFREELNSGIPIAVIAQYHVREWPEAEFIVPNVVDIHDPLHKPVDRPKRRKPVVSYAPSNANCRGWDDKSYGIINPILKRREDIFYQRIYKKPHDECLRLKQQADIGIDEISTGSYHLSSLEYLSMGVATIGYLDAKTEKVVKDITGAAWLPWIQSPVPKQLPLMEALQTYPDAGKKSRQWMETYWTPEILASHYLRMYSKLV